MSEPLTDDISVVIPACNAAHYLPEAVASVRAQSLQPREILLVDDGSTDDTAQVARSLGLPCIGQENQGVAVARNTGLSAAQGALIAFLDADDVWADFTLEKQTRRLRENPEAEVAMGLVQPFRGEFQALCPPVYAQVLGAALIRRGAFERLGMFDPALRQGEDTDWFLRAMENGLRISVFEDVVLYYRRHDRNITGDRDLVSKHLIKTLKMSLDRRRAGAAGDTPRPLHIPELPERALTPFIRERDRWRNASDE